MLYKLKAGIRIFRKGGPLGLAVERDENSDIVASNESRGCFHVLHVAADGAVASEGSIEPGDKIVEFNGASVGGWSMEEFVGRVRAAKDPIVLSVVKCNGEHGSPALAAAEMRRLAEPSKRVYDSDIDEVRGGSRSEIFGCENSGTPHEGAHSMKPTRVNRLKNILRGNRNHPSSQSDSNRDRETAEAETDSMEWFQIRIKANGCQLGVMLSASKVDGSWFVKGIIDGSPVALEGSMREGDRVERLNGRSIVGLTMDEIRPMLRTRGTITFLVSRLLHEVSLKPEKETADPGVAEEVTALKKQVQLLNAEIQSKDREIENLRRALETAWHSKSSPEIQKPKMLLRTRKDSKSQISSAPEIEQLEMLRTRKDSKPQISKTVRIESEAQPDDDRNDLSPSCREDRVDARDTSDNRDATVVCEERSISPTDILDPSIPQRWADSIFSPVK